MATIIVVPRAEVTPQQVYQLRNTAQQLAQQLAHAANGGGDLVSRAVSPADLFSGGGIGGARAVARLRNPVALRADTWAHDVYRGTEAQPRAAIALYGYEALSRWPRIDAMRLGTAAVTFAELQLAPLYAYPPDERDENGVLLYPLQRVGYFNPVYIAPTQRLVLSMLASRDLRAGREEFCFLGVISEPPINVFAQPPVPPDYQRVGYFEPVQFPPAPDRGDPDRPGDEAHFRRQLQELGPAGD